MKILKATILLFFLTGCADQIKNTKAKVNVEEGTEVIDSIAAPLSEKQEKVAVTDYEKKYERFIGAWVGYFEKDYLDDFTDNTLYVDEGYTWNRENKINISITHMKDGKAFGRSIVAGNDRPFEGIFQDLDDGSVKFELKEPGDDRYDGQFNFIIANNRLKGKWKAYQKIEIRNRKYDLEKKSFEYDPSVMLQESKEYVDWTKVIETRDTFEMDENEFEEWISREFASATELIYKINASEELLAKETVENLKKGDLTIIRNTIYARHGYSYKNRPLRVFFDAQDWYIPMHTDIKKEFTEIEKKNIALMLKYEKNAAEYYDYFGRG